MSLANPGDVVVSKFTMTSDRGKLDLANGFLTLDVYEGIFSPGMMADVRVQDADDFIGELKLVGDEEVEIELEVPGGESATYKFAVESIENANMTDRTLSSRMYVIRLISKEALMAKTNFVQKSYKKEISSIVEHIHKEFLKSEKPIEVEKTKGQQDVVLPNYNPYKAIDVVRRRAVSDENKSSSFVYFETREGGQQAFKFVSIEKLFKGSTVKTVKQLDTMGYKFAEGMDEQVACLEIPKQFDSVDRVQTGGKRRVSYYDFRTQTYKKKDVTPDPKSYKTGGEGSYESSKFKQDYYENVKNPPPTIVPVDYSQRKKTDIPEKSADQLVYIATLMQNAVKMRVMGDFALKPGVMIDAKIPVKKMTTGPRDDDKMLSGKFLVTRVKHEIAELGVSPRFTTAIECVKGNPEEGV